jgi:hypothetical protein
MDEQSPGSLDLEKLWEALLSQQANQVQAAFNSLDDEQQAAIFLHLQRMLDEPDWQPEQRKSAQFALAALKKGA